MDRWMFIMNRSFFSVFLLGLMTGSLLAAESSGFRVPDGFEVTHYAGDDLAHDIFAMTTDTRGRVVVAGEGYIKILEDTDGDGKADKAKTYADMPKSGAHGLLFDEKSLYVVGDDAVWRFDDTDGDDIADGAPVEVVKGIKDRGHCGNGLVRGPDGWLYLISGNDAGVSEVHATLPGSPVKKPSMGTVLRFPSDGVGSEILAHGLRNPYDICFNQYGHMFTVDADGERILGLPYYAPNRLFDLATGMHHGWGLEGWRHSWSRPDYLPDTVEWLNKVGRGSPTGMLAYRHWKFPARYQQGVFSICWTFGRVYFYPLEPSGSSYQSGREIFMETTGDVGFAPVDMAVHPYGDLFVAIGGRGTEGGVFRVSYKGDVADSDVDTDLLNRVIKAPQPYSAWSRADWLPMAKLVGKSSFERVALDKTLPVVERIRAIEILVDVLGGLDGGIANKLLVDESEYVAARAVWALGRGISSTRSLPTLAEATRRDSAFIQRAAWETLACWPEPFLQLRTNPDWIGAFRSMERRVRATAIVAARGNGVFSFEEVLRPESLPREMRLRLAFLQVYGPDSGPALRDGRSWSEFFWNTCLEALAGNQSPINRLEALRLMQLGLGDVKLIQGQPSVLDGLLAARPENLEGNLRKEVLDALLGIFPSGIIEVDYEAARLMAMMAEEDPRQFADLTTALSAGRNVEGLLFYLAVTAALPGERSNYVSTKVAEALALLHQRIRIDKRDLGRVWNERVSDLFDRLVSKDPELPANLLKAPSFGLPGHVLFAGRLEGDLRMEAANRIFEKTSRRERSNEDQWTAELVEFLGESGLEEALPRIRAFHAEGRFRESVIKALAAFGKEADRKIIEEGLASHSMDLVAHVTRSLLDLGAAADQAALHSAFLALDRACQDPRNKQVRSQLGKLLSAWTGQTFSIEDGGKDPRKDFAPWFDWYRKSHPEKAGELGGGSGKSESEWRSVFQSVDWSRGDAGRGKGLFEQRACLVCHSSNRRLGPSLKGVSKRFGPVDLFTHIAMPELAVSPAFQVNVVETQDGASHSGVLIYNSSVAVLLQTSPETTLRFTGEEVKSVTKSTRSLMPSGLLQGLDEQGLADLHAYLKGL